MKLSGRLAGVFYIALIALQPVWHGLLPPPVGAGNWLLAAVATAPLLLPMRGVLAGSLRSMTWAGYLVMLYLAIGIMEAWSSPAHRVPALIQTGLVIAFVTAILLFSGSFRRKK